MALTAIHPGEHLAEELETLNMGAAELARKINVPTNRVTQILNGTRAVTGDTALRLAHFFGTSAEFWLNLQSLYELRSPRRRRENPSGPFPDSNGAILFTHDERSGGLRNSTCQSGAVIIQPSRTLLRRSLPVDFLQELIDLRLQVFAYMRFGKANGHIEAGGPFQSSFV
jgi:antitoxin HigA-1